MTDPKAVQVTILGTGTSTGVPVINCACQICTSDNPKDSRLRCSCYIQVGGVHLLIDTGPDFRQQAMRFGVQDVDAVLITHHHSDHVVGLDDLRPFSFHNRREIPCYAVPDSAEVLKTMFSYIFRDGTYPGVPRLTLREVAGPFSVSSRSIDNVAISVVPIPAIHGSLNVLGYRIGNFAYLTDVSELPNASLELLKNLDVLVLDALRDRPHPMHLTIDQSIVLAEKIGAKQTYFTHMSHEILHADLENRLAAGIAPAYDGLRFEVSL